MITRGCGQVLLLCMSILIVPGHTSESTWRWLPAACSGAHIRRGDGCQQQCQSELPHNVRAAAPKAEMRRFPRTRGTASWRCPLCPPPCLLQQILRCAAAAWRAVKRARVRCLCRIPQCSSVNIQPSPGAVRGVCARFPLFITPFGSSD